MADAVLSLRGDQKVLDSLRAAAKRKQTPAELFDQRVVGVYLQHGFDVGRGLAGLFGKFRDDPTLREICEQAYKERDADVQE